MKRDVRSERADRAGRRAPNVSAMLNEGNPTMPKVLAVIFVDPEHLADLVSELRADGYGVSVCPDELKPHGLGSWEFLEASRDANERRS